LGLVQAANVPPSRLQRNDTPPSASVKANDALVELVIPVGPVIDGPGGGVRSIVHAKDAGAPVPAFDPDGPSARTWNVWDPAPRAEYDLGLVQVPNEPASSLHSKAALEAFDVNGNDAVVALVGLAGPEVIVAVGTTTDHVVVVSELVCPDFSARTPNVWLPTVSAV
jgi:hypothetical protein